MATKSLKSLEKKIRELRCRLGEIGDMRPGSLTVQYRHPEEKKTPFNQISYTHKGKSRSEYVRGENLRAVQREINEYKRFKSMVDELIDLSVQASRIRYKTRRQGEAPVKKALSSTKRT